MSTMINSEQKSGIITKKRGNTLYISILEDCFSASSGCNAGCGSCGGESKQHQQQAMVSGDDYCNYSIGEKVTILHYTLNENLVAFIVFGIPVVLAVITILAWYTYNPQLVESPAALISAAIAFAVGFLIVRLIDMWFRAKYPSKIIASITIKSTDK